jgi:hypothetical protein
LGFLLSGFFYSGLCEATPSPECPFHQMPIFLRLFLLVALSVATSGCMVIAVADAAVTVVATTVKVGAAVVGTTVDVATAGVKAVAGSDDKKKD